MPSRPPSIKQRNMNYNSMLTSALSSSPASFYTPNDTPHLQPQLEDELSRVDSTDLPQRHRLGESRITARTNSSDTLNMHRCSCSRQVVVQSPKDDETDDEQQPLLIRNRQQMPRPGWLEILSDGISKCSASLYLENTGSVARDHLANERTYLAWLRSSLSTISVGVGITQLFRLDRAVEHDPHLQTWGRPVGLMFICMAMIFLCFGFVRYFHSQTTMTKGYFPASRGIVLSTSAMTFLSMCALLLAVFFKR
ncbi:hypothetical protein BJV82DRAFT_595935 [Fennellomyces sp. T-0311]|nr:hypothetical protein BJV82DRAFT_595935 [Fennellomyces sp. T-0311]